MLFLPLFLLLSQLPGGQHPAPPTRVLFIGNSYTYCNDMPFLLQSMASAGGDSLDYIMEAPDGASFEEHYQRGSVHIGFREGPWDYIVFQEQSLRAAMPLKQVEREFFQYGELLIHQAKALYPKAKPILYTTWGRWHHTGSLCQLMPMACGYWGADSLITLRYHMLSERTGATIAPVGPAWRHMQKNHPQIELFYPDAIHPSPEGSFLAACCLYAVIFGKDPACLPYDYVLPPKVAALLREVASEVVWEP